MEQEPKAIKEIVTSDSQTGYGFGWQKSGVLGSLMEEIGLINEALTILTTLYLIV